MNLPAESLPIPDIKPWWQSRIIIAAGVTAIIRLLHVFGVHLPGNVDTDKMIDAIMDLVGIGLAIYIVKKRQDGPQATVTPILPPKKEA